MLYLILKAWAALVGQMISFLPEGPTLTADTSLLVDAVSFLKGINLLINVPLELTIITTVFLFEMYFLGFKAATWIYNKIRGSG